jgi:hypothetical protein
LPGVGNWKRTTANSKRLKPSCSEFIGFDGISSTELIFSYTELIFSYNLTENPWVSQAELERYREIVVVAKRKQLALNSFACGI